MNDIPRASGIYRIVCEANGKVYVGSAVNLRGRWAGHRSALLAGKHANAHLQRAWSKYGSEAFRFEVVELVERGRLLEEEQKHIDGCPDRFNICKKAGSTLGVRSNVGKARSAETRARQSAARKGATHSEETKAAMRAASARRWSKVKAEGFSEETRTRQRAAGRRKVFSKETRAKLSAAAKRRMATPEGRAHQRAASAHRWSA